MAALSALVLLLGGCGVGARGDAAEDVARFLAAAQSHDRVAFEAQVDRPTVRDDLRRRIAEAARADSLDVDGGPSEFTLDRMIAPAVIHVVDSAGEPLAEAPRPSQVATALKKVDDGKVCLQREGGCLLTFARSKEGWRLVSMPPSNVTVTF